MHDSGLLLDIYRCAKEPLGWSGVLDRLCEESNARSAVLQAFRLDRTGVRVAWQVSDSWTRHCERLTNSVCSPRIDRGRMLRGVDQVVGDDDIFERDEPARELMRAQLAHCGLGAFMGALRVQFGDWMFGIALHRALEVSRDFGSADAARLEALVPHFGQAWELSHQLQGAMADAQRMRRYADALRCGVLQCDGEGRVHWINQSARQLVAMRAGLVMRDASLRASIPSQSARLLDEIAAAARSERGAIRYLALGSGSCELHLAMQSHSEAGDESPTVLVVITSVRSLVDVPLHAWSRLLGVTPAEAALIAALAQGMTVDEHAAQRGIATGTARNQLKQVMAKTNTSRQADLVRLALTSAAAHVLNTLPAPVS